MKSHEKALEKAKGGKKVEIGKLHRKINDLNPAALDIRQKNRHY